MKESVLFKFMFSLFKRKFCQGSHIDIFSTQLLSFHFFLNRKSLNKQTSSVFLKVETLNTRTRISYIASKIPKRCVVLRLTNVSVSGRWNVVVAGTNASVIQYYVCPQVVWWMDAMLSSL